MTDIQKQLAESVENFLNAYDKQQSERSFESGANAVLALASLRDALAAHRQQEARGPLADEALDLLEILFDAYENGTPCYEEPEESAGYVGNAIKLDDEVFERCCTLLEQERPRVAIEAAHGIKGE